MGRRRKKTSGAHIRETPKKRFMIERGLLAGMAGLVTLERFQEKYSQKERIDKAKKDWDFWVKYNGTTLQLDSYVKSICDNADLKDVPECKDNWMSHLHKIQGIFAEHEVPLNSSCASVVEDKKGQHKVKLICRSENDDKSFKDKVKKWNEEVNTKLDGKATKTTLSNVVLSIEEGDAKAEYESLQSAAKQDLVFHSGISLVAATVMFVLSKYIFRFFSRREERKKERERERRMHEEWVRLKERRKEIQASGRVERITQELPAKPSLIIQANEIASPKKRAKQRLTREELIGRLDAYLEEQFGIKGLVGLLEDRISKRELRKLLREPQSIYYTVRDNREYLKSRGLDYDALLAQLRSNEDSGEFEDETTFTQEINIGRINFNCVLEDVIFAGNTKEMYERLREGEKRAFLRSVWRYQNGKRIQLKKYPEIADFFGFGFGKENRVLFMKDKESGKMKILEIFTSHQDYDKFLRVIRKNKGNTSFQQDFWERYDTG